METVFNGDARPEVVGWQDGQAEPGDQGLRILNLSSWMMILGTVRLICAFGDYLDAFLSTTGRGVISLHSLGRFIQDHPPAIVLGLGWPLALGLILRRTQSLAFVRASAATFSILSLGGIATLLSGLFLKTESDVVFGSFTVSRWGLLLLQPPSLLQATLGLLQLAFEFLTACLGFGISRTIAPESPGRAYRIAGPRRSLHGRLAIYVTLAFLVLNCRQMAWSAYLAVLNRSTIFRHFVLRNDGPRPMIPRSALINVPAMTPQTRLDSRLGEGDMLAADGRFAEAARAYLDLIQELESQAMPARENLPENRTMARALNNLAWLLATCEDTKQRRPGEAVAFAKRAVALFPRDGNSWNTLGVAYYRTQAWEQSIKALERSMELRGGQGTPHDWYFLAMIHARRSEKDRGLPWYERAIAWSSTMAEPDPELYRFQVEAAEQLGLEKPAPPENLRAAEDDHQPPTRTPRHLGILRRSYND